MAALNGKRKKETYTTKRHLKQIPIASPVYVAI
jgi:hypothetical protein